jgi:hypothetical protein
VRFPVDVGFVDGLRVQLHVAHFAHDRIGLKLGYFCGFSGICAMS